MSFNGIHFEKKKNIHTCAQNTRKEKMSATSQAFFSRSLLFAYGRQQYSKQLLEKLFKII